MNGLLWQYLLSERRGVIKMFAKTKGGMTVEQIIQKMKETQEGLFLSEEEIRKMLRHLEQMEEYAACGKAYREEVSRNVVKLCGLAQPQKFLLR